MALYRHADGLAGLYAKHLAGHSVPDFAQLRQLEKDMEEAAKHLLWKVR